MKPKTEKSESGNLSLLGKMVSAIDQALAREPSRTGLDLTAAAALEASGQADLIYTAAQREKYHDLMRQWNLDLEAITNHTYIAAKAAWLKHEQDTAKAIHAGTLASRDSWTLADYESDYAQIMEAAKRDLRRIYSEFIDDAAEIVSKFADIANRIADDRESNEREIHAFYGVPYSGPSAVVSEIRRAVNTAKLRVQKNEHGATSPKDLIPFLTL